MVRGRAGLGVLVALALCAQGQTTFYAAFEDGREAEAQGRWRAAIIALERAVRLRPAPAARILTYGNNLLTEYYPYQRLARCHLELGEREAAAGFLGLSEARGEPAALREPLAQRLARLAAEPPAPLGLNEPAGGQILAGPVAAPPAANPVPLANPAATRPGPAFQVPVQADPPAVPRVASEPGVQVSPALPGSSQAGEPSLAVRAHDSQPLPPGREPLRPIPPEAWAGGLGVLAMLVFGWLWRHRRRPPPAFQPMPISGPDQLGPYRILRPLGHGGSATAYLARHDGTGLEVALKVLHAHHHQDPGFQKRFAQEARLGALLDHPHLVRILDPGPERDGTWIAMEYIPGPTLAEALVDRGPLPLGEALEITLAIAEAMAHAHAHGVVHRDLKPANVILGPSGLKVMDLGIARDLDGHHTTTYSFLGTPLYSAPESQLLAKAGPAVDRYSLGAILYEMLAGTPPFTGETAFALLEQHRSAPAPDIRKTREVPPRLARLLERLLAKDPDQRPEDGELVAKLQQIRGEVASDPVWDAGFPNFPGTQA